jgi:phage/plasmid-associated DNA primase
MKLNDLETAQFDAFLQDVVIPITTRPQLQFTELYAMYARYCRACDQEPMIAKRRFSIKLKRHIFNLQTKGHVRYYCTLRDVFQPEGV